MTLSRNGGAQPPSTISIRGLDAGPRLTPNSISTKNRPMSAIVDRLVIAILYLVLKSLLKRQFDILNDLITYAGC